jgi:predicted DNA binding CopG/RHH family protein
MPRGRPRLPEGSVRDRVVRVRLTRREASVVTAQAAKRGINVSEYIRRLGLPDQYPPEYFRMRP